MKPKLREELTAIFKNRVSFDKTERKLYSHDIASMPKLIKPLIGASLASAVLQPQTDEEISTLVKWANKNKIRL